MTHSFPTRRSSDLLCLVPDADFFEAMKAGKASVVTDPIERFDAAGIQLKSGKHLEADIIITATGLKLARSEEHTSELQSLMRISYAVFCLNKKIIETTKKVSQD